jgi:asparagine synthase (glutamine-hydrolysing)
VSAIVALFGSSPGEGETEARAMLREMSARGGDRVATWTDGAGTVLGVSRADWELTPARSGEVLLLEAPDVVVAADASLYDRQRLLADLDAARLDPGGESASHLIAAAWRAWGANLIQYLEGDFAFVVWDRRTRTAALGRDIVGRRPLHLWHAGERLVVASTVGGVVTHPACPRKLNIPMIAVSVGGHFGGSLETGWVAVRPSPASTVQVFQRGRLWEGSRWEPPAFSLTGGGSTEDAVEELRALLVTAMSERLDQGAPTAVWMSGGWDSTAVYASTRQAAARGAGCPVHMLSMTFEPGDIGNEDAYIQAVADQWKAPVHWVEIERCTLLSEGEWGARDRDDPGAHPFETFNRTLAARSAALGARVAFDGHGGDSLFQVSRVMLADLLFSGRLVSLAREWRTHGDQGFRAFFRWAIRPRLGPTSLAMAKVLRGGRPLGEELLHAPPPWLAPAMVDDPRVVARQRDSVRRGRFEGAAAFENRWYITSTLMARALAWTGGMALASGAELRSPLLDRRLIRFAASRPVTERSSMTEGTKRLLRRAMADWLPADVLAPRARKTGLPSGWLHRRLRAEVRPALERTMAEGPLRLADLGIVEPSRVLDGLARYERDGEHLIGAQLFLTVQAERWLRAWGGEP